MFKEETKFWHQIKKHKCKISWTRLENSAAHGTPDLLGYNNNHKFFTVELKLKKAKKITFSPHQISFHIKHPKNTFIMVKELPRALGQGAIKLYEGTEIHALVGGTHPEPVACGLSACCLFLERL
jgi:hypothetical protein|tara:strand:+ start:170 stop:544 length:375 start_codon:yes stop_codon:yes gene_type:complete